MLPKPTDKSGALRLYAKLILNPIKYSIFRAKPQIFMQLKIKLVLSGEHYTVVPEQAGRFSVILPTKITLPRDKL